MKINVIKSSYRGFFGRCYIRLILTGAILVILFLKPQAISSDPPKRVSEAYAEVTLLFIGDIMQHMPQVEAAWNDSLQCYSYDSCFQYVRTIISDYDFAIANLETTLAGKPYSGYPAFSSPDELVSGMKNAGIDLVGTANNHSCDRGLTGVTRTIEIIDRYGLQRFGTYKSDAEYKARNPLILRKNGISIAMLNYTYGTNGIPVPDGTVVSLIEKDRISRDLQAARDSTPDKIIVYIHWGDEYQREPNAFQKDIASFCFEHGADIIIGSHPHVIQPMEWSKSDSSGKEKLVVWSLGNYVSNQRKRYTDGGAMAGITLRKENGSTRVLGADYQLTWVYNPIRHGKRQYYILPLSRFEQDSVFLDKESFAAMKLFAEDSRQLLKENVNIFEKK